MTALANRRELRITFNLYLITDRKLFTSGELMFTRVEDALKAGVKAVQLREKDLPIRILLNMAYEMRELTRKYDALLFINDRVDITMSVGADGVHLGHSSIPVHAVRKIVGEEFLIGASAHTMDEAVAAEKEGADFITFGPIYRTASKLKYGEPVGVKALRNVRSEMSIPVFGIGGIKPVNVKEVLSSGAFGVAVISGVLGVADVRDAARNYLDVLGGLGV